MKQRIINIFVRRFLVIFIIGGFVMFVMLCILSYLKKRKITCLKFVKIAFLIVGNGKLAFIKKEISKIKGII
jgi:hypothetical protein